MIQSSPDSRTVSSIASAAPIASAATSCCPARNTVTSSAHASPAPAFTIAMLCWMIRVAARPDPDRGTLPADPVVRRVVAPAARPREARREVDRDVAAVEAARSDAASKTSATRSSAPHAAAIAAASGRRTSARTRWPRATSRGTRCRPYTPVAPRTATDDVTVSRLQLLARQRTHQEFVLPEAHLEVASVRAPPAAREAGDHHLDHHDFLAR